MSYPLEAEDLFVWCDGSWCYREDLRQMDYKGDDYEIFYFWSENYDKVCAEVGAL